MFSIGVLLLPLFHSSAGRLAVRPCTATCAAMRNSQPNPAVHTSSPLHTHLWTCQPHLPYFSRLTVSFIQTASAMSKLQAGYCMTTRHDSCIQLIVMLVFGHPGLRHRAQARHRGTPLLHRPHSPLHAYPEHQPLHPRSGHSPGKIDLLLHSATVSSPPTNPATPRAFPPGAPKPSGTRATSTVLHQQLIHHDCGCQGAGSTHISFLWLSSAEPGRS